MAGGKEMEATVSIIGKLDPSLIAAVKGAQQELKKFQNTKAVQKAMDSIGKVAKRVAQGAAIATGAAAAGIAKVTASSLKNYAQYEQLVGGVDTLFKGSSQAVQDYANAAYKTAGISANDYMNTITSFSASLLQSLGGDTQRAAEMGNMAVTDMADNANKMGTDIASIQNAYQSLARGQYGMLDNLKLGEPRYCLAA